MTVLTFPLGLQLRDRLARLLEDLESANEPFAVSDVNAGGGGEVIDRVSDLRECSLIQVREGPETRYELLETVRELAAEMFAPQAWLDLARRRPVPLGG